MKLSEALFRQSKFNEIIDSQKVKRYGEYIRCGMFYNTNFIFDIPQLSQEDGRCYAAKLTVEFQVQ